jgi:hypothetical protein
MPAMRAMVFGPAETAAGLTEAAGRRRTRHNVSDKPTDRLLCDRKVAFQSCSLSVSRDSGFDAPPAVNAMSYAHILI